MIVIVLLLFIMVAFVVGMLYAFTDVFESDSTSSKIQDDDSSDNITLTGSDPIPPIVPSAPVVTVPTEPPSVSPIPTTPLTSAPLVTQPSGECDDVPPAWWASNPTFKDYTCAQFKDNAEGCALMVGSCRQSCGECGGGESSEHTSVEPKQIINVAKNVTCTVSKGSCPSLSCPPGMECGCYTTSGLGNNKKAYKDAGADRGFLASAMMETEKMDANYAYGDNKTHDSFNAGATKQNWGMMRQCHPEWVGKTPNDYSISDVMNNDRSKDVAVYNECKKMFGDKWFAGHRNGASGLINPNTKDIQIFKQGYDWTYKQLEGHECDDVRFWVNIPAI